MTGAVRSEVGGTEAFLGREAELRLLLDGLAHARAGRGRLFLIGGEPGIGKSRLADEFARQARDSGAQVLWGRCWEGAGAPAYWPWIQALRGHLRHIDSTAAREQLGSGAADIAQMLPEIKTLIPGLPPPLAESDSARFQLFDSTCSFLRNVARDRETVLVLDDLHAADTPSILLLRFIATQLSDMHLIVVGTYRDVELTAEHPLRTALAEVVREPITRSMTLKGLDQQIVTRLIESAAGVAPAPRLAREMWRETSGNPLFLGEAVRLLVSERRLEEVVAGGSLRLSVPAGVREVIARRVRQLTPATVKALTVGAALGPEFSLEALRRIDGQTVTDPIAVLDEAIRAGLLAPVTGSRGRLRFAHDLIRESVYQEQPPADRVELHRRIAETLEEMYGGSLDAHLAELAHHYFEAAHGAGEREAPEIGAKGHAYAWRAGQVAAQSLAYEEAARLFRMALAMLDLQPSAKDDARAEVLLAIGDAEARAGEIEAANAAFLQAAEIARRTGTAAHLARAALGVGGRLPWARPGNNPDLIPLLQEALVLLGGEDEQLRVRLLSRLATAWRSSPDKRQQSDTLSQQAVGLARRLEDPAALSYALAARYWATWWPDNPAERLHLAMEMITVSEAVGDAERMVDARLMLWLSHTEAGQMVDAARQMQEIRRLADELRQPAQRWLGLAPAALTALMQGDFQQATELIAREFEPGPPTTPARDNISAGRFHRFLLARELGQAGDAENDVRQAVEEFPWYPLHQAALALLLIDLDRRSEARAVFDVLANADFSTLYPDNEWLLGMSLASEACALLGDTGAAGTLYEQLAPFAGRHAIGHAEGSVGAVDRYLGLLATTMDRLDDAERHLTAAIALNDQMGARPWAGHSRHDLAQLLRRRAADGDIQRAIELEDAARQTAHQLGMTALVARLTASDHPALRQTDAAIPSPGVFRREGEYWTIVYVDESFRLGDAKGLRYLARLLADPGREILALDLVQEAGGESARGAPLPEPELVAVGLGDAGAHLDAEAKAAYGERLRELRQELAEAERFNDSERAGRTQAEIDFLARELARAVGLGGRDRNAASATERARVSATRAIRGAMVRIARHSAALGEHLETTIHTGTYCAYRPDSRLAIPWEV